MPSTCLHRDPKRLFPLPLGLLLLGLSLALLLPGCASRPSYREIHATNSYHHDLTGTEVVTRTHYYRGI
jgi:hypothetical protein